MTRFGAVMCLMLAAGVAGAQPPQPAARPPQPAAQPQQPAGSSDDPAAPMRLGRKYPVPGPSRVGPKAPPEVHVSVVSPEGSSVHQKTGRFRRGRAGDAGQTPIGNGTMR